jgi:alpha-glucosidase
MSRRSRLLLLLMGLLFHAIGLRSVVAQYTNTAHGILLDVKGKKVELEVVKKTAFRISICFSGAPTAIQSVFVDTEDTTHASFDVISNPPSFGIQTSFGKLMVDTSSSKWSLYDKDGNALIPNGTFSISATVQNFNDGPKGSGTFYGSGNMTTKNLIKTSSSSSMNNGVVDIPYLWNTIGYSALGVTSDDENPATWNSAGSSAVNWNFPGTSADLYIWPAKTLYDALNGYTQITGKPKIPPRWAFGYLQSRWGWQDRNYIENAIDSFRILKLPVDAFIYDFEWYTTTPDYSIGSNGTANFSDFGFNAGLFPQPATQISNYHNRGIKFIGIRKPRLGNTANLDLARGNGWLENAGIGNRDINFSIAGLRTWYETQTKPLLDAGVDAWWDDEGESYYTCYYWWNKTQLDLRDSVRPNDRHFSINRAFSPGNQRMGYSTWNGDIQSSWNALLSTPSDLLNWSLSGMYYGTCDIGGFQGTPSTENLVRWFQAAVFFPVMRAHSTNGVVPRFPWLWGSEGEAAIRDALNLRYQLIPYIYSLGHEAYVSGAPIMRPLIMEFQEDDNVADLKDEWLLGKGLLAAPIMNQGGTRNVYLPDDQWYEYKTNKTAHGPLTISVTKALDEIPIYIRAGTILPVGPVIQYTGQDTVAQLEIHIYPGHDGTFTMTEDDGKTYNYTNDSIRTTLYTWTEATYTLSWHVTGSYTDKAVFTSIKGMLGDEEKSATLGTEGSIVFDNYDFPSYIQSSNESQASVKLYPNPANEFVYLDLTSIGSGNVIVTISDIQGKLIYSDFIQGGNLMQLNISDIQNGIYIVHIRNELLNYNCKLLIAK